MSPFEFNDYRAFLQSYCRQPNNPRGIQAELARAAGCQASYFSQMLKGNVHLTEDQALGVTENLGFSSAEVEYFLLLIRHAKAATPKLRAFLEHAVERSRRENLNLSRRVATETVRDTPALGEYFSSWIPSAIHLLTSSSCNTITKISRRLALPESKVDETLKFLRQQGFVKKEGEYWKYQGIGMHLPKNSPWQSVMQHGRRQLALKSITVNSTDSLHFSSLFTIDKKDFEKLKEMAADFVEASHKKIGASGTEELVCLCFDLFPVI